MTQLTSSDIERFWSKVNRTDTCWLWTAAVRSGYGAFKLNGNVYLSHRIAWQISHDDIPSKQDVCHICDVPLCVNPAHLFLGSRTDNMQDASQKGRLISSRRKFSTEQIIEIKNLYENGMMQVDIAARFHVSKGRIWEILNNKTYRY